MCWLVHALARLISPCLSETDHFMKCQSYQPVLDLCMPAALRSWTLDLDGTPS